MDAQDPKVMGLQPSELDADGLRRSLAELRKKVANLEMENDDLMREVDAARNHRATLKRLFFDLHRVVETYREVPDREPEPREPDYGASAAERLERDSFDADRGMR